MCDRPLSSSYFKHGSTKLSNPTLPSEWYSHSGSLKYHNLGSFNMNGHTTSADTQFDVLIIGSGLSGINAAYRIQESLPNSTFAVLEGRHELGGTWSQFKYPGVRSDSDLHTLGFQFHPWKATNPIASGESIMSYLNDTAHKFNLDKKIRYNHKVTTADWRSNEQRWRLEVDVGKGEDKRTVVYWTKWLITGTGYYNYEEAREAKIPGLDSFKGQIVQPQFWPEDLDYKGKKMVIIGSGATTITLLPAMVDGGVGSVTQLQRSPSYIMSIPQDNAAWWEKYAPEWFLLKYKREYIFNPTTTSTDRDQALCSLSSRLSCINSACCSLTRPPNFCANKLPISFPPISPSIHTSNLDTTPGNNVSVSVQMAITSRLFVQERLTL